MINKNKTSTDKLNVFFIEGIAWTKAWRWEKKHSICGRSKNNLVSLKEILKWGSSERWGFISR